jgi:hypothetical protein
MLQLEVPLAHRCSLYAEPTDRRTVDRSDDSVASAMAVPTRATVNCRPSATASPDGAAVATRPMPKPPYY